jgi:hypothetical protein
MYQMNFHPLCMQTIISKLNQELPSSTRNILIHVSFILITQGLKTKEREENELRDTCL